MVLVELPHGFFRVDSGEDIQQIIVNIRKRVHLTDAPSPV